jgi:paraquat-inducible protein B
MSKKANPTLIGVFVLVAVLVAGVAIAWLGSGRLFQKTDRFVMYFEGDLSGLDVGAPVEYKGVRIGNVKSIHLEYNSDTGDILAPVYVELEPTRLRYSDPEGQGKGLSFHIYQGLRAQLQSQSLVTGKLKIMLLEAPDTDVRLVKGDLSVGEIPTIPNLTEALTQTLKDLPLGDIVSNINTTLQAIASFTRSEELTEFVVKGQSAVVRIDTLASNLNDSVPTMVAEFNKTSESFRETLVAAEEAIQGLQKLIADARPAGTNLTASVSEVMDTARRNGEVLLKTQAEMQRTLVDMRKLLDPRSPLRY